MRSLLIVAVAALIPAVEPGCEGGQNAPVLEWALPDGGGRHVGKRHLHQERVVLARQASAFPAAGQPARA